MTMSHHMPILISFAPEPEYGYTYISRGRGECEHEVQAQILGRFSQISCQVDSE